MFKSEYTLGLVASILNAVVTALLLIGLLFAILFAGTADRLFEFFRWNFYAPFDELIGFAAGIASLTAGVVFVLSTAATVVGFVGTSQLARDNRNGGVLLIVSAGLSLLTGIGFITMILLLIGGIIALSKKQPVPPGV